MDSAFTVVSEDSHHYPRQRVLVGNIYGLWFWDRKYWVPKNHSGYGFLVRFLEPETVNIGYLDPHGM